MLCTTLHQNLCAKMLGWEGNRTENCTGQQKPYAQGSGKSWHDDNIAMNMRDVMHP